MLFTRSESQLRSEISVVVGVAASRVAYLTDSEVDQSTGQNFSGPEEHVLELCNCGTKPRSRVGQCCETAAKCESCGTTWQKASGLYTERTIGDQKGQIEQIPGIQHELGESGNLFWFGAVADLESGPRSGQARTTVECNLFRFGSTAGLARPTSGQTCSTVVCEKPVTTTGLESRPRSGQISSAFDYDSYGSVTDHRSGPRSGLIRSGNEETVSPGSGSRNDQIKQSSGNQGMPGVCSLVSQSSSVILQSGSQGTPRKYSLWTQVSQEQV